MTESNALAQILTYMDENRIKAVLEANFQQRMVVEANKIEDDIKIEVGQNPTPNSQRLDCIYKISLWDLKKVS